MESYLKINGEKEMNRIPKERDLHFLPCTIEFDGIVTNMHSYFIVEKDNDVYSTSFRGRALKGVQIAVPEGMKGRILEIEPPKVEEGIDKKRKRSSPTREEVKEREGKLVANFDSFYYWEHDDIPNKDSKVHKWFEWYQISDILHSPITEEQINKVQISETLLKKEDKEAKEDTEEVEDKKGKDKTNKKRKK